MTPPNSPYLEDIVRRLEDNDNITQALREAYELGYSDGYNNGRRDGYDDGYHDGSIETADYYA